MTIHGVPLDHLKRALNCDRSVFIQACAGAGKTFALTKRYAAILDRFAQEAEKGSQIEKIDPKKILVITFTKKAAAEMKERIYKDVSVLLSGKEIDAMKDQNIDFGSTLRKEGNQGLKNYKQHLKERFSQNAISTIDSFCAGILREFAYKLGLDPQFLSQDDHDAKRLLNENLDVWLSKKLSEDAQCFNDLLGDFSFNQIKEILKKMYGSREILNEYINDFVSKSNDEIWREWLIRYTPNADIENLVATFEALWKNAQSLCHNEKDVLFVGLKDMVRELMALDRSDPLEFRAAFISDIIRKGIFVTKTGTYLKQKKGAVGNWSDKKEQAMGWFQLLQDTIEEMDISLTPNPLDKKIIPLLKHLISFYRDFNDYYLNIRMDRDLLDFSDIIILTHKLLSEHEDVRTILGQRYRHIMLDEFQDTNPLRWQIIKMILDAGRDIKLFIVGDRKQSIYRFNNADVTVMNTAEELVRSIGGDPVDFNDNYRSSEDFIRDGINALMSMIMKKPGEEKEAYEADFKETTSPQNKVGISPAVERIWCETEKDEEDYIPAYHAAWQVKRLLAEYENTDIDPGNDKPLIAILLRRYTKISDYLQAFHKLGIPVSILGGKDFYSSSVLKDIFYFISVLDNSRDDHALIGLLRSPFFALPDPIIHLLSKREKISAFDAMGTIPELQAAYRDILFWKEASKTQSIDELIASILDENDRELGYVSELMPEQQLANFDKALNIIRGQQRNGATLRDIREFVHYQIKTEAQEAQADYPATARVHILTVHKAKGLEYPIVIIPEMNQKGRSDKDKFRYGRYENHPEISLSLSDDEKPGMLLRLKEITKQEEEAEDKRKFYVALTRAIYKVLLLGEGEKATANTWWDKYALGSLGLMSAKEIDSWNDEIELIGKEKILAALTRPSLDTLPWKEKEHFTEPGKYLYRSPHDLMGKQQTFDLDESKSGLGHAPGKLFHYCMEQVWLNMDRYSKQLNDHIAQAYPTVDRGELLTKVRPWLANVDKHKFATILLDNKVEKYSELKVKAWLGNDHDVVQVNGTVDLLYKEGDRWTILDYKTDASKRLLPLYKKQLQSYQWMIKQAYGIVAEAKIYFVALDEVVEVDWQDSYFDELPLEISVKAQLPSGDMDLGKLIREIKEGKQLILCASGQHEEQVYLALVKQGFLRPDIIVSTLSRFLHEDAETGISPDNLRLMIKHRNPDMKEGTADYLAKALREEELRKGRIKKEFRSFYQDISQSKDYRPANLPYAQVNVRDQKIILLDVYIQTEIDKEYIERLRVENELIELSLLPDNKSQTHILIEAFSPREEVLAVAQHIKENCGPNDQLMIAVASMEKYAPHLQRQLPQMGLKARFIGPRSLFELPCIALVMNYLELCRKPVPEWKDISPILMHPLMKPGQEMFRHDQDRRQKPLEEKALSKEALKFCKDKLARSSSDLLKKTKEFIENIKADASTDMCKACDKFLEVLEKLIFDLMRLNPKTNINAIVREMNTRIKKEGIPRRDQFNGIPVVGLLDSLGAPADKLYVLGMVEGDIPRQENENPFFKRNRDYSLELNRHFMQEWKKLGESVVFCSSTHAEDGSEQSRSSFLEELDLNINSAKAVGRRQKLLSYANHNISDHNALIVNRHKEILEGKREIFSGDIAKKQNSFDISVTNVETLLACPIKFYYNNILKCSPIDQEEALFWGSKKGNVVHKTYEYFIENKGYELDINEALELMKDCLNRALEYEKIDVNDPQQMDHFRNYVKNLYPESDKNCLVKNLNLIAKDFSEYKYIESERSFDDLELRYDDIHIVLRGRIDKIMINEEEKKLIASDFKTGTITPSMLSKMMLSQLYLYLKKCGEIYPGYEQEAMYETLKDPKKDTKLLRYYHKDGEFRQGKQFFIINEFEKHLRDLFSQIADGKYYITEKSFKDACKYCSFEGLCRRDTRVRNV